MAVRTIITSKGVETRKGRGFHVHNNEANAGFMPYQFAAQALTANTTLTAGQGGLYTISGSGPRIVITLPSASLNPMCTFVFRNLSGNSHRLTASQEVAGTRSICVMSGTIEISGSAQDVTPPTRSSGLTLFETIGSSVALLCDGVNYLVIGASGSIGLRDAA